jgi:predicted Rossmann fold flavoprotein
VKQKVVIVGGGAAGFFAAINIKLINPDFEVVILEKSAKLLSKVLVSGGGRCNVTNHCLDNSSLVKNYPRGEKELMQVFSRFSVSDTIAWFKQQGIILKTEPDNRMFPVSNSSETIANCFLDLAKKLNINILLKTEVQSVLKNSGFHINTTNGIIRSDKIVISSGGS